MSEFFASRYLTSTTTESKQASDEFFIEPSVVIIRRPSASEILNEFAVTERLSTDAFALSASEQAFAAFENAPKRHKTNGAKVFELTPVTDGS